MAASGQSGLRGAWSGYPVGLIQWPGAWSGSSMALCHKILGVLLSHLCLWPEGLGDVGPQMDVVCCCVLWSWAGRRVLVLVTVLIAALFFKP